MIKHDSLMFLYKNDYTVQKLGSMVTEFVNRNIDDTLAVDMMQKRLETIFEGQGFVVDKDDAGDVTLSSICRAYYLPKIDASYVSNRLDQTFDDGVEGSDDPAVLAPLEAIKMWRDTTMRTPAGLTASADTIRSAILTDNELRKFHTDKLPVPTAVRTNIDAIVECMLGVVVNSTAHSPISYGHQPPMRFVRQIVSSVRRKAFLPLVKNGLVYVRNCGGPIPKSEVWPTPDTRGRRYGLTLEQVLGDSKFAVVEWTKDNCTLFVEDLLRLD